LPIRTLSTLAFGVPSLAGPPETHVHPAPEKLGGLSFPVSCKSAVQSEFNRGVDLLHSFAYAAQEASRSVADDDPRCAMAHWGIAMTYFRQRWEPPIAPASIPIAQREIQRGLRLGARTERECKFLQTATLAFQNAASVQYLTRAANYEHAMDDLTAENPKHVEKLVFCALALLADLSPADKTHGKQKHAADVLFGKGRPTGKLFFTWPKRSSTSFHLGDPGYATLFPFGSGQRWGEDA
jgi:hypothetical protein